MWARPQIYAGLTKQEADTLVWQGRESQYKVKIEEEKSWRLPNLHIYYGYDE